MNKEQILYFAFNRTPSNKGLIYSYIVDESNRIIIKPRGFLGDDWDENIVIHRVDSENIDNLPTESEIDKALDDYINLHGRDSFKIN